MSAYNSDSYMRTFANVKNFVSCLFPAPLNTDTFWHRGHRRSSIYFFASMVPLLSIWLKVNPVESFASSTIKSYSPVVSSIACFYGFLHIVLLHFGIVFIDFCLVAVLFCFSTVVSVSWFKRSLIYDSRVRFERTFLHNFCPSYVHLTFITLSLDYLSSSDSSSSSMTAPTLSPSYSPSSSVSSSVSKLI